MREQHILVRDGDHVVVERAGGDRRSDCSTNRVRSGSSPCSRAMAFDASKVLTRGEGAARHAVNEQLKPASPCPDVSRIWLAAPSSPKAAGSDRAPQVRPISERQPKLRQRARPFVAPVRHGPEVRHGQVGAPVRRVRSGGDGCRIRRPHGGGRHGRRGERRLAILKRRSQRLQPLPVRPRVRNEDALREAECEVGAHLVDALQRRPTRLRDLPALRVDARLPKLSPA